jgi:hypothetical protein
MPEAKDEHERPEPEHRASRPRRRSEPRRESARDRDRDDDRETKADPLGRDFRVFLKIRGARWLGSEPPTAEAYARALQQWRQLPGAVGVTAADLGGAADAAKPPVDGAKGEEAP